MPLRFCDELPAVVVRERVWVPRGLIINEDKVRSDLTIPNGAVHAARRSGFKAPAGAVSEFVLYQETEGHLVVPRAYSVPLRGRVGVDYRVVDLTGQRGSIVGADAITLGPHAQQPFDQGPAFAALSAPDTLPHGRMLVLRCGAGKTAIALKAAQARGGRCLWVTITDALVEQARDDIQRYYRLDQRRIGWVQASKQRWEGFGIATATLQTLAQRTDLPPAFWDYWDLVIFDEGDVLGAPSFHLVVPKLRAERWVLTATPTRSDGNETLFKLHVGEACYTHSTFDLEPECFFVASQADAKLAAHFGWDPFKNKQRVQYALTARNLLHDPERQSLVLGHIETALSRGRTVLAVGDSIDGMAALRQRAVDRNIECSIVTSQTKKRERKAMIKDPPVVFATSKLFQRGLDRVAFDTLVITSMTTVNETFTNQTTGRILRANSDAPDKRPLVVVIVDVQIDELRGMAASLAKRFSDYGWKVGGIADKLIAERKARRRQ